jgi:hypothetical protein
MRHVSPPFLMTASTHYLERDEHKALGDLRRACAATLSPPASADPRVRAAWDRVIDGLRKAGMPEE